MPTKEVILIENIPGLGAEADVVKVKAGFARNFLVPQGKAYEVTPATMKKLNTLKAKRAEREARELNEAEELGRRINKLRLTFTLETGEGGKAFGSITAKDVADKLNAELGGNADVDRHRIVLEHPIKNTGAHEIEIKLHPDVTATLKATVKSATEAAPQTEQAAGETPAEENERGGYKARPKARHAAK
jgi:large subunit ribosomal protein L9